MLLAPDGEMESSCESRVDIFKDAVRFIGCFFTVPQIIWNSVYEKVLKSYTRGKPVMENIRLPTCIF